MKCITLRRTKNSEVAGHPLVVLPQKKVCVEYVTLSQRERDEYELARTQGRTTIRRYSCMFKGSLQFSEWDLFECVFVWFVFQCLLCVCRYVADGTVLKNYADVLAILVRLRQHCCHCDLLPKTSSDNGSTDTFSYTHTQFSPL